MSKQTELTVRQKVNETFNKIKSLEAEAKQKVKLIDDEILELKYMRQGLTNIIRTVDNSYRRSEK